MSKLIANQFGAYICDECIGLCNDLLREAEPPTSATAAESTAERVPLLTPAEVAAVLRCSIRTAKRVMSRQRPVYVGRLVRWPRIELEEFLARGGVAVVRGRRV